MAPTIIVGDDESAGDVARDLLAAADNQRDVRVRTDLARPAFEVPEALYKSHVGRKKRGDDEQRINSVEGELGDDTPPIEGDELPESARVVEPGTGDVGGEIVGDELPESARVVAPPSNGDEPDTGDTGTATDGDAGNQTNSDATARTEGDPATDPAPEAPKPRKRASTSSRRAAKSTPAAAGSGE